MTEHPAIPPVNPTALRNDIAELTVENEQLDAKRTTYEESMSQLSTTIAYIKEKLETLELILQENEARKKQLLELLDQYENG